MSQKQANSLGGIFAGGGQMGTLMHCFDWASTSVGSVEKWPPSLRTSVSILLNSHYPIVIAWGSEFLLFYNDAYIPLLGDKHPYALGQTIPQACPELWLAIAPVLQKVIDTGEGGTSEDIQIFVNRNGYLEEVYINFSYSPICDENGLVAGIFISCSEKTQAAIAQRRWQTIRDLAAKGSNANTVRDACRLLMASLGSNTTDIPFALLYLIEPNKQARLIETVGCKAENLGDIEVINLTDNLIWRFAEVVETRQPIRIDNLPNQWNCSPPGNWTAVTLPIAQPGQNQLTGILVVGVNNKRVLDKDDWDFFELIATEIKNAIANARVYEQEHKRTETSALRQQATEYEQQLRQLSTATRDKLHSILESITDSFVALDKDWRIVYINQKAARKNGQTPEEIIGKNHWEHWHWLAGTQVEQEYRRAVAEQVPVHFEVPCQPLNTWLEIHAYPSRDGLNVFLRDITERKRIELKLRESEERLRLAVEGAGLIMWDWDLVSGQTVCSDGSHTMFGLTADIEITYEIFLNAVHPDDRERVDRSVQGAIAGENDYSIEYRSLWADGTVRWLVSKARVYRDENGKPMRMIGIDLDITAQKQIEEALRQSEAHLAMAQKVAQVGSWEFDLESQKIIWSETTFHHWGFEPTQSEPSYAELLERVYPDDREILQQFVERAIAQGIPYGFDMRIVLPDGSIRYLDSRGEPVFNEQGQVVKLIGTSFDISDRKHLEEELRRREQELAGFIANAPIGIHCVASDGTILWANQAELDLLGYSPQEYIGQHIAKFYADQNVIEDILQRLTAKETLIDYEASFRCKDGSIKYVLINSNVLWEDNRFIYSRCFNKDISDRKQAEEALRLSEARFRLAMENLPELFMLYDAQRRFQFVNTKVLQLSGRTLEQLIGRRDEDVFPAEVTNPYLPLLLKTVETGQLQTGECTLTFFECQKCEPITFIVKYVPLLDSQGKIQQILGLTHDITHIKRAEEALRQREQEFRALAENSPDLICRFDRNFCLRYVNPRVELETGIPVPEWIGKTLLELGYAEAITNPWHEALQKVFATKQELICDSEFPSITGIKYWSSRLVPEFAEDGSVKTVLAVCRDITSRRQAELELQQAKEAAEAASRIKDEFLAILSHELRSPLTPILAWAQILRLKNFDATTTEYALETIERNAKLQTQLVDDLLDVSCIIQGKMTLNIRTVNLVYVIQGALETIRSTAQAKAIQIQTFLDYTPHPMKGDISRLQQIVWNLLSNAVKFTPEEGTITVKLEYFDSYAQIQVSDTGKGINPDFLPHVFKRFSQESNSTTRKYGGLGLGLSIVHYLTQLHGGSVKAESPGENLGTTFTVCLPFSMTECEETGDKEQTQAQMNLSGVHILVVDDEVDMRELLARMLKDVGADVTATPSATEALAALQQQLPDILLADIAMPKIDGYMLMHQVRALPSQQARQIPAIALTAYAGEYNQQRAIAAGFQMHIAKPVEPKVLIEAIVSLLKGTGDREQ
ncbi:PAS domain S-box protein [Chlorogloeopsis sp. ULAP01]|uniref:PAS domain S-box protein n=1 Tax=Chlorogloeopsis sp. ULAP01 TaxID=3056483 RepID=UPI0025AAEF25|nr:PAS domain S-box protein [Chlorogloeopsis sp. ULAP01]MDM9379826.1 PAS domain S-box protein [Chlorogloeopsis sp. ULAP01]